jgi:transcriptional regulator with XRE-family HTH domain
MVGGGIMMKEKKELNLLIGSNIKREREKANFTQDEFSELIGIGSKSLSAVECGSVGISLSTLTRICKVLSISSDTLLFENRPENDISVLTDRLRQLSPKQFQLANDLLCTLLAAFALSDSE